MIRRVHIRSWIAFVCGFLAAVAVVATIFVLIVNRIGSGFFPCDNWIPDALVFKRHLINKTPSPKVVVMAGSGSMFGVDSEVLSEDLGLPVVNLALHASIPIEFYPILYPSGIGEGDIVILPLEVEYYLQKNISASSVGSHMFSQLSISLALGLVPELRKSYSPLQLFDLYAKYGLNWISKASSSCYSPVCLRSEEAVIADRNQFRRLQEIEDNLYSSPYDYRGLTDCGDMLVELPFYGKRTGVHFANILDKVKMDAINDFIAYLRSRGATVVFCWPNLYGPNQHLYQEKLAPVSLSEMLEKRGVVLAGAQTAFSFPEDCYYDSFYHLNRYGAKLNAHEIARAVSATLGIPLKKARPDWPHVPMGYRISEPKTILPVKIPSEFRSRPLIVSLLVDNEGGIENIVFAKDGTLATFEQRVGMFWTECRVSLPQDRTDVESLELVLQAKDAKGIGFERLTLLDKGERRRRPGSVAYSEGFTPISSDGRWSLQDNVSISIQPRQEEIGKECTVKLQLLSSAAKCQVYFGDREFGEVETPWIHQELEIKLRPEDMTGDPIEIRFQIADAQSPKELGLGEDERNLGVLIKKVEVK